MLIKNNKCRQFITVLTISIIFFAPAVFAQDKKMAEFRSAKSHWTFLGGYGVTHPGFGATRTRVETVDFVLQYGYFLSEETGKSWYRGRHEMLIEIPVRTVVNPETALITGINFLACWNFTASERIIPYVCAGGGPVYTNLNISGLGSEFNGNYQAGPGFNYFIRGNTSINLNYRLHHISNSGAAEPNEPLNSSMILLGISFFQ